MAVVTIRGQLGSGANEVGKLIARRLGCDYVDREIIAQVAGRVRRSGDEVAAKEEPSASLVGRILEALSRTGLAAPGFYPVYLPTWEMTLGDKSYVEALAAVIKRLAWARSIVIRGRGSQFILKNHPGAVHVLTVAPVDVRLPRVMETLELDEAKARKEMERVDNSRRAFIKRHFSADLEDPHHYHLVLNTGQLTFAQAASAVLTTLDSRLPD